ncbi:MAG: ABC transporter six-transmembrane domain-containing protein [Planctomycetota bacterium]|nr:ABC transporter six-transmembrane domain-containing protein [Planctomycetota bacterium]MDA1164508.1 ABC transporter six-transmembrane domain-containing protein [Planctomycetota bacterium]
MPIDVPVVSRGSTGPLLAEPRLASAVRRRPAAEFSTINLRTLFSQNRIRILATYALFAIENLLRLAQPFALGWAINGLLTGELWGVAVLIVQHVLHLAVGLTRQVYDTRTFSAIYSELATRMIVGQREAGVDISRVTARASLSREFVEFFEQSIPMIMRVGFSVIGSVIMLAWYDWMIVACCLGLLIPAAFLSHFYSERTRRLSRGLHDELEREVDVIGSEDEIEVRNHFDEVARWRVRLSNAEAMNFGLMECFILGAIVAVLFRSCQLPAVQAGDIFAVFRYLMLLLMGLDNLPRLIQQVSRLRDVSSRMIPS